MADTSNGLTLRIAGATDVGRVRDHNEDSFAIAERHRLFLVADGMGGHDLGEVASKIAVDAIVGYYDRTAAQAAASTAEAGQALAAASRRLVAGIQVANQVIFELSRRQRRTMGTTIVAAQLAERTMCIAHVGDSRAYLVRDGSIARLTRDHSALEDYIQASPDLTPEDIRAFPYRNVILRALGTMANVEVDTATLLVEPGDRVLLCCDGLSNMVNDEAMAAIVSGAPDVEKAAAELVAAANEAGADDNVTAVLAECAL